MVLPSPGGIEGMRKTTTWTVSIEKLAKQGSLGAVMVRLMMAVQDFALANHAMEIWNSEQNRRLQGRKIGARMYFLRLQISHINEAFEIIKQIKDDPALTAAVDVCDPQTRSSYQKLLTYLSKGPNRDDYKLFRRIRNNVGFHYAAKEVLGALERLERRQARRRKEGRWVQDSHAFTLGNYAIDWHLQATEAVEDDIVVHDIFRLPENDDPVDLLAKTDDIIMRLQSVAGVLADFAGHFVKYHAKA
jgi:hypothetical protein